MIAPCYCVVDDKAEKLARSRCLDLCHINCDWVEMFLGSTEADGELFSLLKVQLE